MSVVVAVWVGTVEHRCQVVITRRFVPEHITAACSAGDWTGGLFDCVLNAQLAWQAAHAPYLPTPGTNQQKGAT